MIGLNLSFFNAYGQTMSKIIFENNVIQYYTMNSENETQILLVHGLGDNHQSFDPIISKLNGLKLILIDLPGCGINRDIFLKYEDYPDILLEIIKKEKRKSKKTIIIGHSFGGLISLLALQKDSHGLIDKLITIEPSITDADKDFFKFVQEPPIGIGFEELKKNSDSDKGYLKIYKGNLQSSNPDIIKENIESVYGDFNKNQKQIFESEKPFVYCYGKNSSQSDVRNRVAGHKFIKVKAFDNAEHWVHYDQPEIFTDFLKEELK